MFMPTENKEVKMNKHWLYSSKWMNMKTWQWPKETGHRRILKRSFHL